MRFHGRASAHGRLVTVCPRLKLVYMASDFDGSLPRAVVCMFEVQGVLVSSFGYAQDGSSSHVKPIETILSPSPRRPEAIPSTAKPVYADDQPGNRKPTESLNLPP